MNMKQKLLFIELIKNVRSEAKVVPEDEWQDIEILLENIEQIIRGGGK